MMASRARALPVAIVACLCAALFRGLLFLNSGAAPPSAERIVRKNCQLLGHNSALALGATSPAIIAKVQSRPGIAAYYSITLQTPAGKGDCVTDAEECEIKFECPEDTFILDQAEESGIDMPYSCRAGSCALCAGKVLRGTVDQDEQTALDDGQVKMGYCMTCVAYPTSDVTIRTHCEDQI